MEGEVQVRDGGPLERMQVLLSRPVEEVMFEVCARVVEGDSLVTIARDWGLPRHRFMQWVMGDAEREAAYQGALRLRADEMVHEAVGCAPLEKRSDVLLRVAGLWDRQRFGKGDGGGGGVRVVVNRGGESVTVTTEG